ncbi:MAG: T9SS type A sorting domain-containing protein [candidate division KSB1 bacterium]|nr:T9SS type A sorting domain-containing protein [candidate division KSB1 bacterium]MDZ7275130.1 T9SS type A sorting domain-containing protein [candidate division KSB1 bacterium]MDZ7287300.1 T9SS type A sorting domain-containing protein [candidate division KSB1 bacterium]MDZ7299414.1 T9SS type A sorting domain-containing protein [candidate division KSB1 bacterium]MDZ7308053.1 T9SS type A sorting domain-containing protein [candidate division KSB1 bacterium]
MSSVLIFEGKLIFDYGGLPVSIYPSSRAFEQTCLGNNGKITVVWLDGRTQKGDIYAQSLGQNGNQIWSNDAGVSLRPDSERSHRVSSDGNGGCIVAWYEIGTGSGWGIFAQQVSKNGGLGEVLTSAVSDNDAANQSSGIPTAFTLFPNPFGDSVQFDLKATPNIPTTIRIYDLTGKIVRGFQGFVPQDGKLTLSWDGRNQDGKILRTGIYLIKVTAGEFITSRKVVLIR